MTRVEVVNVIPAFRLLILAVATILELGRIESLDVV